LKKYPLDLPALSGIGYKQIGLYLEGKISKEEAIEKFKQGDRNLAKRQLTWFKKNKDIIWIQSQKEAEKFITNFIKK
jgi:tRNA dimethylallyltransferase